MLCNMIDGKCTHCGGTVGGRCRLSRNSHSDKVTLTTKLLNTMGIPRELWDSVQGRFGIAPDCNCPSRQAWIDAVTNAYGVEYVEPAVTKNTSSSPKQNTMGNNEQEKLDKVVEALEAEGVNLENYQNKKEGLGDVISNVFSKLGVTEETVEKWSGIGGCGCQKRKKFLNKIIPFRKKA